MNVRRKIYILIANNKIQKINRSKINIVIPLMSGATPTPESVIFTETQRRNFVPKKSCFRAAGEFFILVLLDNFSRSIVEF